MGNESNLQLTSRGIRLNMQYSSNREGETDTMLGTLETFFMRSPAVRVNSYKRFFSKQAEWGYCIQNLNLQQLTNDYKTYKRFIVKQISLYCIFLIDTFKIKQ